MTKVESVASEIKSIGILPVFYHDDVNFCKAVLKACYNAGVRAFEFTDRGEHAVANFSEMKQFISENNMNMLLGIGSILREPQAQTFLDLGADFVVSPIFNRQIVDFCAKNDYLYIPGCGTATEAFEAAELGCKMVKVFPAESLGASFVSNVLGPMPHLQLMPTGGVEPNYECLEMWFKAGVVCVGMGSQLLKKSLIASQNFSQLESDIAQAYRLVQDLKLKYKK